MNVHDALLAASGLLGGNSGGGGSGGDAVLVNKTVTTNGTYNASSDSADGYKKVTVNVPGPTLTAKTITENGIYIPQDDGADGYSSVTVEVDTAVPGVNAIAIQVSQENVVGSFPHLSAIYLPLQNNTTKTIDIVCGASSVALMSPFSTGTNSNLTSINLHGATATVDTSGGGWSQKYGLCGYAKLRTVNAKLRVTYENTAYQFRGCNSLENVEFQENAQTISLSMSACPLTEASLVSVANGLNGTAAKTLTLSSARKTMCAGIMGSVSTVTDGEETYDLFTADPNGTVTLTEFITNTKGWTLA